MGTHAQVHVMVDFDGEVSGNGISCKGGKRTGFMVDRQITFDDFVEVIHFRTGVARTCWNLDLKGVALVGQQDAVTAYNMWDKCGLDMIFHLFEKDDKKVMRLWMTKRRKQQESTNMSFGGEEGSVHVSDKAANIGGEGPSRAICDVGGIVIHGPSKESMSNVSPFVRLDLNEDPNFGNEDEMHQAITCRHDSMEGIGETPRWMRKMWSGRNQLTAKKVIWIWTDRR